MTESNRALAQIFSSMADLLVGRGDNPHRVRAYRRAVDSLMALTEDVRAIAARGGLREIPGVGKELAAKIEEYLATGQVGSYESLKTPLPAEAVPWTQLPGMTEPLIQYLYVRLGVRSLDDLAALVRSHLLRTLPGFTGTEEALLAAIEELNAQQPGG
ncbi:MAG TPA: histidinol-phosphatase [Nitrospirales bacterium]|nr:histidinol-phosphatase [Nitrospirales bacterium]